MESFSDQERLDAARKALMGETPLEEVAKLPTELKVYVGMTMLVASGHCLMLDNSVFGELERTLELLTQGGLEGQPCLEDGAALIQTAKDLNLYVGGARGKRGLVRAPEAMRQLIESCDGERRAKDYLAYALRRQEAKRTELDLQHKASRQGLFADAESVVQDFEERYGEEGLSVLRQVLARRLPSMD